MPDSSIGDEGAVVFGESLRYNISHNQINDVGACNIFNAIQNNKTLKSLDISCNNIGCEGAVIISECLKYNNTLNICNNYFDITGVDEIFAAIITLLKVEFSRDPKSIYKK